MCTTNTDFITTITSNTVPYSRYDTAIISYTPKRVIFNPPYTIVEWTDKTKTIVRCGELDEFEEEKGFAMAIAKRIIERGKFLDLLANAYHQPKKDAENEH